LQRDCNRTRSASELPKNRILTTKVNPANRISRANVQAPPQPRNRYSLIGAAPTKDIVKASLRSDSLGQIENKWRCVTGLVYQELRCVSCFLESPVDYRGIYQLTSK